MIVPQSRIESRHDFQEISADALSYAKQIAENTPICYYADRTMRGASWRGGDYGLGKEGVS